MKFNLRKSRILFSGIVLLSIFIICIAGISTAAAQTKLSVTNDKIISSNETGSITVNSSGADYLGIKGDTAGWEVKKITPSPSIIGNPTTTPYKSGDEEWYYAEKKFNSLTINLNATVDPGTYEFTAVKKDTEDNVVASENFDITVTKKSIDVVVSDSTVSANKSTTVTVESNAAEYLEVTGDTEGWTVTGMDPKPLTIGNPINFPSVSKNEAWYYADSQTDKFKINLEATVQPGTYDFTATEQDANDEVIAKQPFSVTVTDSEESKSNTHESGVSEDVFDAVDQSAESTGDGGPGDDSSGDETPENNLTLSDLRNSVNDWSDDRKIGNTKATLSDLRTIVKWWSTTGSAP